MIKINEIFFSIQGESSYMGHPTVFVRTSGCHLRCTYCDTKYAYHEGTSLSVPDIIEKIKSFKSNFVCITGGEPLLQKDIFELSKQLCDFNYNVSLETSGDIDCAGLDLRVRKIIDVKTPDSGAAGAFEQKNLMFADVNSEFKFVICSEKDFDWAEKFCKDNALFEKTNVLYSPSYGVISENWLAKKILSQQSNARLQLQLHKYIWSPHERGV
ncbi:MAG: radical SAM protein [Bdellovibrionales bacterium]|nr:radical SAM protein [Bdellovibrionales bacterium]